jgi:DNA-binding transcriptional ArsR family regulator
MVNIQGQQLDLLFYALSDATRRQILVLIRDQARTISELAQPFEMSLAAVSKHIKVLERARLLVRKKEGRIHSCTLDPAALKTAEECIQFYTQFWTERLDVFAKTLEEEPRAKRKK